MLGLLIPAAVALVAAQATGGSVSRLTRARLEWWWLLLAAFAVELVLYNPPVDRQTWAFAIGPWLWVLTKFAMLAVLARNAYIDRRASVAWTIMLIGIGLNTLAIVANDGHMPQSAQAAFAALGGSHLDPSRLQNVALMTVDSRLPWLCDVIPEPVWLPRANVVSIGDVSLASGAALWVYSIVRPTRSGLASSPMSRFLLGTRPEAS